MQTGAAPTGRYLAFDIKGSTRAIPLGCVDCVVPALWTVPAGPGDPKVWGFVNIHAEIIPLIDVCLQPDRVLRIDDHFVIIGTSSGKKALWIGGAFEIFEGDSTELYGSHTESANQIAIVICRGLPIPVYDPDSM
jgi:chemotaxis signal transduction protein